MNKIQKLDQLKRIAKAAYEQKQSSFQSLVAEETKLRNDIEKLNQKQRDRNKKPTDFGANAVRANIIWQAWVGERKTEINMKLARVLALKEQQITMLRKDYGKCLITDEMALNEKTRRQSIQQNRQLTAAITQALRR